MDRSTRKEIPNKDSESPEPERSGSMQLQPPSRRVLPPDRPGVWLPPLVTSTVTSFSAVTPSLSWTRKVTMAVALVEVGVPRKVSPSSVTPAGNSPTIVHW